MNLIPQLQKRLDRFVKQSEKNDKEYTENKKSFECYFSDRFEIDKKINGVFELQRKKIREQEFSDKQLDIWLMKIANEKKPGKLVRNIEEVRKEVNDIG
ncbi:hypothetical protein Cpap_1489 [Ruminiclostridium papyrosolvens DSM 2782]|uniref:Uncharacterized protein n=1 Tax=Ruminiclostridium papyrosolvens DSM 2782 TaxID=588581 RepID=F1TED1_9FIRM|nr:hypothetical protein [Ruminiclostridium papyrosolvens]EGD47097.1 hypothetical protein Cpap_1489 [Ruminiclostridium papyrosolvens DSM 2782]WES36040.1 hypothetical protein P0092_08780 [Ruminiclostridium papyrosolvens DSM 2782]WES36138.1 hypothetical protein P0092_09280 [Ruminiclostridium papyrosolvens DSM 2782]